MNFDTRDIVRMDMRFEADTANGADTKADADRGIIKGWASTPAVDSYNTRFAKGAFDEAIRTRGIKGPNGIKLLVDHQRMAGQITKLETRGDRLWIEGQLHLGIGYVRDAYELAKMNGGTAFSIGFRPSPKQWSYDEETRVVTFNKVDLREVSMVTFPANPEATMEHIRSMTGNDADDITDAINPAATHAEFEKRLVALGLVSSRNDARRLTQVVKAHAHLFQRAGTTPAVEPTPNTPPVSADFDLSDIAAAVRGLVDLARA